MFYFVNSWIISVVGVEVISVIRDCALNVHRDEIGYLLIYSDSEASANEIKRRSWLLFMF